MPAKKANQSKAKNRYTGTSKSNVKVSKFRSNQSGLSRTKLIVFAIIFAAIGGYILTRSFADTTGVRDTVDSAVVGVVGSGSNNGYWLTGTDGGVFSEGTASSKFYGSAEPSGVKDVVGMSKTNSGNGYWLLGSDGGVFAFGDAKYYGGGNTISHSGSFVGIASASDGGYWLLDTSGQVFFFTPTGEVNVANFTGNISGFTGIAATADGNGFWAVDSYGQVYTWGNDANYYGAPTVNTVKNIVGIVVASSNSGGYWEVGSDGGVFSFGNAQFYGSMAGTALNGAIVGIDHTSDYGGYWLAGSDGGVFAFGDAQYQGAVQYTAPAPTPSQPPVTTTKQPNPAQPPVDTTGGGGGGITKPPSATSVPIAGGLTAIPNLANILASIPASDKPSTVTTPTGAVITWDPATDTVMDVVSKTSTLSYKVEGSVDIPDTGGALIPLPIVDLSSLTTTEKNAVASNTTIMNAESKEKPGTLNYVTCTTTTTITNAQQPVVKTSCVEDYP